MAEEIQFNSKDTLESIKIVYGHRRIKPSTVYAFTNGNSSQYLWMVDILAEGECDSIYQSGGVDQIFLNKGEIWTDYTNGDRSLYHSFSHSGNH